MNFYMTIDTNVQLKNWHLSTSNPIGIPLCCGITELYQMAVLANQRICYVRSPAINHIMDLVDFV